MEKRELLYEGKAKKIFKTDDEDKVVVYFKDDATAFNAQKKGEFSRKGELNNAITSLIFQHLEKNDIETHFISKLNEREQIVKKVEIIPLEMIVRNYAAGSMAQRLGVEEGTKIRHTVFEICYKKDELGDPLINNHHAVFLGAATYDELEEMYAITDDINRILKELFLKMNIILVDFKIELGRTSDGKIVLADEISPDTCRLWEKDTLKKLDKDRFRRDLGEITEAYEEIYARLQTALNS